MQHFRRFAERQKSVHNGWTLTASSFSGIFVALSFLSVPAISWFLSLAVHLLPTLIDASDIACRHFDESQPRFAGRAQTAQAAGARSKDTESGPVSIRSVRCRALDALRPATGPSPQDSRADKLAARLTASAQHTGLILPLFLVRPVSQALSQVGHPMGHPAFALKHSTPVP